MLKCFAQALLAALVVVHGGAPVHRPHRQAHRRTPAHHRAGARARHRLVLGTNLPVAGSDPGQVVRADTCWECVEPWPGIWNWAQDDATSRLLGKRWQPVLDYAPGWATAAGVGHRHGPPPPTALALAHAPAHVKLGSAGPPSIAHQPVHDPPEDVSAFVTYAVAVVKRYRPAVIEVWNEPDINVYWNAPGSAAAYGRLFVATYRAIKRVAPATQVLAGGLDETNGAWFVPALARALGPVKPDGWSVHPYAHTIAGMRSLLHYDEHLLSQFDLLRPFYVTEYGCWSLTSCPSGRAFRRAALRVLAQDPHVVQADWLGNIP